MNNQPTLIENILEHARWAPSGDNMQTWRFEIIDTDRFVVLAYDTRDHCVYDLQGHASQLAVGTLLESIAIAASAFQHRADFTLRENTPKTQITIDVLLTEDPSTTPDPLFPYLPIRSVQRRALKTTSLDAAQKSRLADSVGNFYTIKWIEGWQGRRRAAMLMFKNAKLRLTLPEAYPTHSTVIEWNARFSEDKIPDQAVGLDPLATRLMQWALRSWRRVKFLNTFLAGTILPRIELDLVPGLCCAAHFGIVAQQKPQTRQDYLNAGRALQRFWLTATQMSLHIQPEMTPLIFSGYMDEKIEFTRAPRLIAYAEKLSKRFKSLIGDPADRMVFMGRIGFGDAPKARSKRLPLDKLLKSLPQNSSAPASFEKN